MGAPQVIVIPALAGIGANAPIQIPLGSAGAATLLNLNSSLGITLCSNNLFATNTTWPLGPQFGFPNTGLEELWAQNPNDSDVNILVLEGVVPISLPPVPTTLGISGNEPFTITDTGSGGGGIQYNVQPMAPSGYSTITFTVTPTNGSGTLTGTQEFVITSGGTDIDNITVGSGKLPYGVPIVVPVTLDWSSYNSVNIELQTSNGGVYNITVDSIVRGGTTTIAAPPPTAASQTITYTISSPSSGTAPITDAAGNIVGEIPLNQPAGTYTITVPIVTPSAPVTINPPNKLQIISSYSNNRSFIV